jgi:hypothetical protein
MKKTELIAILFFTLTIADLNIELPGLPIKIRAIIGVVLFIKILIYKVKTDYRPFLKIPEIQGIFFMIIYFFLISWGTSSLTTEISKTLLLSVITVYCGYYFYSIYNDYDILKISLYISGFICFADLVYTYLFIGNFPVQRITSIFMQPEIEASEDVMEINHNFFGCICGISFLVLLNDYIINRIKNKTVLILLPLNFLGVLMSTSRSTLFAILVISLILVINSFKTADHAKRTYKILGLSFGIISIAIVSFISFKSLLNLDSKFLDNITLRMTEEPVAVIRKKLGYNYNIQDLDAMDWREEAAKIAYNVYTGLPLNEQIFGIGKGAYLQRNLGHNDLNPHNGILLILLETGMVGLISYTFLISSVLRKSLRYKFTSLFLVLVFMIFYSVGQNEEITGATTFLFMSSLIGENENKTLWRVIYLE